MPGLPSFDLVVATVDRVEPLDRLLASLDRDVDQMLEKQRWMLARQAERAEGDSARVRVVAPAPAAPGGAR